MNKDMLLWNQVTKTGFPEKTGSYCAIIDDVSFGMREPRMVCFFKKGVSFYWVPDRDDYYAEDVEVIVPEDGFYELTPEIRENYLKKLPVVYWLELPEYPEEYRKYKMRQIEEQVEEQKKAMEALEDIDGIEGALIFAAEFISA